MTVALGRRPYGCESLEEPLRLSKGLGNRIVGLPSYVFVAWRSAKCCRCGVCGVSAGSSPLVRSSDLLRISLRQIRILGYKVDSPFGRLGLGQGSKCDATAERKSESGYAAVKKAGKHRHKAEYDQSAG
jgi:hypothetical protein